MKRALVSVSDKTNLIPFVKSLIENGYEIISTGGTQKAIEQAGLPVMGISEVTGFPEIMDGRVKTLHPMVHGGLLSVRTNPKHQEEMKKNGIQYIDMVVVNLYPFRETVAKAGVTPEMARTNIDIGGPAMVRASAKNFRDVIIVTYPSRYAGLMKMLKETGDVDYRTRKELALEAFSHTHEYDGMIAKYLGDSLK